MATVLPFARASAAKHRTWWMYLKIPLVQRVRVRGRHRHVTIWIGPFDTEERQVEWRSLFEAALEQHEFGDHEIRVVPTGRNSPKVSSADIHPDTDPEIAVQMIPQLVLAKMNEAAS